MSGLAVLAVDDEPPALDDLSRVLQANPRVTRLEVARSAGEALRKIGSGRYDAVFMDVRMPELDGVRLASVLQAFESPPAIVFVSGYETAAVQAFEMGATDYLLKPVSRSRVDDAISRIATPAAAAPAVCPEEPEQVAVDTLRGGGTRLLRRTSILYLEAHGDYARVFSDEGRFIMRTSMCELEERWGRCGFMRVHRRFVVNLARAQELRPLPNGTATLRLGPDLEVPVSRRQAADLRRRLGR